MINGYTSLNLTKLDVLDGFEEIKVATGYKIDGVEIDGFPGQWRSDATLVCIRRGVYGIC
jgi:adenylosuccinate synthase